jgi:subtilisin family serine protease
MQETPSPTATNAAAATASSSNAQADSSDVIPGQYLVVFKEGVSNVSERAEGLGQQVGGTVFTTWRTALKGFAIKGINESAAQALRKNPNVEFVEQDVRVRGAIYEDTGAQEGTSWGLNRVDQRSGLNDGYTAGVTGAGVTAYVIDSGVRISHDDFGGRASHGYDFVDDDGTANDCYGHGTSVASLLGGAFFGIAQKVDLIAVRVLDCNNSGSGSQVADGVEWVMNNHSGGPAVINMSIETSLANSTIDTAVQNAIDAGFPVVAAAGNNNVDAGNSSPARVDDAITVAASNINDTRASFSNHGSKIDLFAPGVEVLAADHDSDDDTRSRDGTSFAAPHVAGTVALRLENHTSETPQQVRDAIVQYATKNVISDAQSANDHLLFSLLDHPQPPTNMAVSCVADDSPELSWDASVAPDFDHYEVLKSNRFDGGYSVLATTTSTSYKDTFETCADGTNADNEYYYRTRAIDTESLPSGETNFDTALTTEETPYLRTPSPTLPDSLSITPQRDRPQTLRLQGRSSR